MKQTVGAAKMMPELIAAVSRAMAMEQFEATTSHASGAEASDKFNALDPSSPLAPHHTGALFSGTTLTATCTTPGVPSIEKPSRRGADTGTSFCGAVVSAMVRKSIVQLLELKACTGGIVSIMNDCGQAVVGVATSVEKRVMLTPILAARAMLTVRLSPAPQLERITFTLKGMPTKLAFAGNTSPDGQTMMGPWPSLPLAVGGAPRALAFEKGDRDANTQSAADTDPGSECVSAGHGVGFADAAGQKKSAGQGPEQRGEVSPSALP